MSRYSRRSYFFHQRKRQTLQRRERKPLDTVSLAGEKRDTILTFRKGEKEDLPVVRLKAKAPAQGRQRRPSSAGSRRSSNAGLPPVDPQGPHLTTTQPEVRPGQWRGKAFVAVVGGRYSS